MGFSQNAVPWKKSGEKAIIDVHWTEKLSQKFQKCSSNICLSFSLALIPICFAK